MIELTAEQIEKTKNFSEEFKVKYLNIEKGRKHLELYNKERKEVKEILNKLRKLDKNSEEFADLILYGLLPYNNTKTAQRISTWPVFFDIKKFFKNKGYNYSEEEYKKIVLAIFNLVDEIEKDQDSIDKNIKKFIDMGKYARNFQAGTLSPIFYSINSNFFVINSKTVDTVNFITDEELIDSKLENYVENLKIIKELLLKLKINLFENYDVFDAFCHWMCSKRLGGYARLKEEVVELNEEKTTIDTTDESTLAHEDAIGLLLELGKMIGYRTYVAHPSKIYKGKQLKEITTEKEVIDEYKNIPGINRIDVIWFTGPYQPNKFFEVDDKGDINSAASKLAQVLDKINMDVFIVSPSKNRDKFEKCMKQAQYSYIRSRYKFKTFFELIKLFKQSEIYLPLQKDFFS